MSKKALTSIELLLSLAIISLILAVSTPFYLSLYTRSKTESALKEIESAVHRTKIKAMASELDDNWGIAIGSDNRITIFKGSSYSSRNTNYDESSAIEPGIEVENVQEIIFSKGIALPNTNSTIILRNSNEETIQIYIDSYGNTEIE